MEDARNDDDVVESKHRVQHLSSEVAGKWPRKVVKI